MVKTINTEKVKQVHSVLSLIKNTIDPDAFITGGTAVEFYLGYDFGLDPDIDVFFKSPIFDLDFSGGILNGQDVLKAVLKSDDYSVALKSAEIYYYNFDIMNLAKAFKKSITHYDFTQYKNKLTKEELLNTFDLDECKVILDIKYDKLVVTPTKEFIKAWEKQEIVPHYNMFKYEPLNELQNEKTRKRVEKWVERKNNYFKSLNK